MYKVEWTYIPLTILILIFIFTVISYFYIVRMKKYLKFEIRQLCNKDDKIKVFNDIEPFKDKNFDKQKALSLYYIDKAVSDWSGCKDPLPNPPKDFILLKTFQCYDSYSNKYRNMVVMYKSDNMIIISFSGTKYLSEWVDDANFSQTNSEFYNDPNILIHVGFYSMYKSMRNDFFQTLQENININMNIVCTGHSLGGSLAAICYVDILKNLDKLNFNDSIKIFLYTFASPRVGNIEFANFINNANNNSNTIAYRVVNTEDIIPLAILPVITNYIYEHYNNLISFTLNLKDNGLNHGLSYINFLSS
jgi:triacylglycerol lipase